MPIDNLLLAGDLFEQLLAGNKEAIIRLGYQDVRLGELVFKRTEDEDKSAAVDVFMVIHTEIRDVPEILLEAEGFKDYDEAVAGLRRFYPDVTLLSEVTVLVFELKKPS